MRALHVLDHSLPLHSGYAFRSRNIIEAQRRRGWDPVVLTTPKHEASWHRETEHEETVDGITYHRSGKVGTSLPFISELQVVRRTQRRLRELVERFKPDLIHAHSPLLSAIAALRVGSQYDLPVVYEVRAFWEDAAVDHGTLAARSLKYRLISRMETDVCRRASQIAVLCEGIRSDLIERGIDQEKLTPVPNAVDNEMFAHAEIDRELIRSWGLDDKFVIGFIGSFYGYEGLDLLVDALSRLAPAHPDLRLLLVGGGAEESALRQQVDSLGLNDRVVFAGRIPHEAVPGVYEVLDLAVFPRHSMRLTELVTPLKPLEAMAMRTVCVASDVGGHRELIEEGRTGLLFSAGDAKDLANTIAAALEDPNRMQSITAEGRRWVVEERCWDRVVSSYVGIYDRALSAVRPTPDLEATSRLPVRQRPGK